MHSNRFDHLVSTSTSCSKGVSVKKHASERVTLMIHEKPMQHKQGARALQYRSSSYPKTLLDIFQTTGQTISGVKSLTHTSA
jgi:hypothetical protein